MKKIFQSPKGMHDILPQEQVWWQKIHQVSQEVAQAYGFSRIEPPLLEETALFERGVGTNTDIVEKQMFNLRTKGGDALTLRPEATAGVCRAYIEHGMRQWRQPVKLFYFGPMFRYERPQAGRLRQFWQFGLETIGESAAVLDAQLCQVFFCLLNKLKIKKGINIQINNLGCRQCRPEYKKDLVSFLRSQQSGLCAQCKRRVRQNPLRVLDCKEEKCQRLVKHAPQIIDQLCNLCHNHFKSVLEFLDELGLPYILNTRLVRGLDYYTKTVFEFWAEDDTHGQTALGGGGRYDELIALLGGRPTPAVGWSIGIERLIEYLKKQKVVLATTPTPDVFLAQLGDLGKKKGLALFETLKQAGLHLAESFSKDSIKTQMKLADQLGAPFTLILGQKEALDGVVIIRDMQSGIQDTVKIDKVVAEIKKRLKKQK